MRFINCSLGVLLAAFPLVAGAQSNSWTAKTPLPNPAAGQATGVINGLIYVANGNGSPGVQIYNPSANSWTFGAAMPDANLLPYWESFGVINDKLYVAGGSITGGGFLTNAEVYDPAANSWSALAAMPFACVKCSSGVINGKLYVAGGVQAGNGIVNTLLVYDPATNGWAYLSPMPKALAGAGGAVWNGLLYIMGGNNGSASVNTVEAYDPIANSWSAKASMPVACQDFYVGVDNGVFYAVGGATNNGSTPINIVQAYNPMADAWTIAPAIPSALELVDVAVVNGVLYAMGGSTPTANNIVSTYALTPPSLLGINMYAGLTLTGVVGSTNEIEYEYDLSQTNWTFLTNVVLTSSPYLFIDTNSTFFSHRFYQAIPLP